MTLALVASIALGLAGLAPAVERSEGPRGADPPVQWPSRSYRREFAVCIGVNGYKTGSGFGPLDYAGSDAIAVAQALLEHCGFDQVALITDATVPKELADKYHDQLIVEPKTTREAIEGKARKFFLQSTNNDDVVLFYFAGHGMAEHSAYLLPSDYDATTAPENTVPLEMVVNFIVYKVRTSNRLVILDACRTTADGGGSKIDDSFQEALLRARQQIALWSACKDGQSATEDAVLRHGRFSWALVKALEDPNAYRPRQRDLAVGDVYDYIKATFNERTSDGTWLGQSPQELAPGFRPDFNLAYRDIQEDEPPVESTGDAAKSVEDWEAQAARAYALNELEHADEACLKALSIAARAASPMPAAMGRLWARRALIVYRLGRMDAVDDLLQAARGMDAENASLAELAGYFKFDDKDYTGALADLERAVKLGGDEGPSPFLLLQIGVCQFQLNKFADARRSFEAASLRCKALTGDLHPYYAESLNFLAAAQARVDRRAERRPDGSSTVAGALETKNDEETGPQDLLGVLAEAMAAIGPQSTPVGKGGGPPPPVLMPLEDK